MSIKYRYFFLDMNSHTGVNICEGHRCWELAVTQHEEMHAVTQHEEKKDRRNLHLFPDYGEVFIHEPPISTYQSLSAEEKQH